MSEKKGLNIFGYEITKKIEKRNDLKEKEIPEVFPDYEDVADVINVGAGHYGQYYDIAGGDTDTINDRDLIYRYRGVAEHTEVDLAIGEIVNESISTLEHGPQVDVVLDDLPYNDTIKNHIFGEFDGILKLLNFSNVGVELFKQWYVDGRLYCHITIDPSNPELGIQKLTILDPTCLRKVKEIKEERDNKTGVVVRKTVSIYYAYKPSEEQRKYFGNTEEIILSDESVVCVTSGVMDIRKKRIYSYIHKALKPINQLRLMEDSLVIYRLARAPERRIFYIDTGNLPRGKAEEYVKNIMSRYRNKIVYDANTGEVKDERKHMTMLEDYWLPRQEGGRGTEITTLPGGENLGQIEDVEYFRQQVYKSLNIPVSRIEPEDAFSSGRATQISRDEVKFHKFINRLRKRFSRLFLELIRTQLLLKSVIHESDWDDMVNNIKFDYNQDNHFFELKEFEVMSDRLNILRDTRDHLGVYFSHKWAQKNILKLSDDEIEKMETEIREEEESGKYKKDDGRF